MVNQDPKETSVVHPLRDVRVLVGVPLSILALIYFFRHVSRGFIPLMPWLIIIVALQVPIMALEEREMNVGWRRVYRVFFRIMAVLITCTSVVLELIKKQ